MSQELTVNQKNKELVYEAQNKFIEIAGKPKFEREAAFAIQALNTNQYLATCDRYSIQSAIFNLALTGLTLNPMLKLCYLVPRKGKCVLDISYVGMVKILTDYGIVRNVEADIICKNDKYKIERGAKPILRHIPNYEGDRGAPIIAYAVAHFQQGGSQFETMPWQDIISIKNRSEAVKAGKGSPWDSDEFEMAKKTLIRRLYKYLPKSNVPEGVLQAVSKAIDIDTENNSIDFAAEKQKVKENLNDALFSDQPITDVEAIPEAKPEETTAEKPKADKKAGKKIP